jgi:HEAT repeat protein
MTPREAAAAAKSFALCLQDDDFDRIYDAIETLKAAGPAGFPILIRAFDHHDPEVRALASVALGEFPSAVPLLRDILRKSLKNESASLARASATQALRDLGPDAIEAVPELLAAARFNNNLGGLDAEWALEAIGPGVIPHLFDALTSGERMVKERAIHILSGLDSVQCDTLLRFLIPMFTEELLYVANLNVTSFVVGADGTVLDTISHSDACNVFHAIIRALEHMGKQAKPSVHVLLEALTHHDPMVRRFSLDVFAAMGRAANDAMPNVIHLLHDPEWLVREAAVRAISKISSDPTASIRAMIEALSADDLEVRRDAFAALGYKQPEAIHAVPYLHPMVDALKRDDNEQCYAYIRYLGTFPPDNLEIVVPAIVEMLHDPDRVVRTAVYEVLGAIGIAAKAAIPELFDGLLDVDLSVRDAAARAYGKFGVAAVPTLIGWLRFSDGPAEALVEIGPDAVRELVEAFHVPQHDVRERISIILGRIGPAAVQELIGALSDPSELVSSAAGDALKYIGAASIQPLMTLVKNGTSQAKSRAADVLKLIDESTASEVIRLIEAEAHATIQDQANRATQELEGIEVMGDEAVLAEKALDTFRRIGEVCKVRKTNRFTFKDMQLQLGLRDTTIQERINKIGKLFRKYFKKFEYHIDIPLDTDDKFAKEHKLFDRGKGKRESTICEPLGWRAWELACQFLERRETAEAVMRRVKRHNS